MYHWFYASCLCDFLYIYISKIVFTVRQGRTCQLACEHQPLAITSTSYNIASKLSEGISLQCSSVLRQTAAPESESMGEDHLPHPHSSGPKPCLPPCLCLDVLRQTAYKFFNIRLFGREAQALLNLLLLSDFFFFKNFIIFWCVFFGWWFHIHHII